MTRASRSSVGTGADVSWTLPPKTVRLSTRTPLLALALRLMREELREAEGRRIDLNAEAAADGASRTLRVHDLRVRVAQHIEVSGRIG